MHPNPHTTTSEILMITIHHRAWSPTNTLEVPFSRPIYISSPTWVTTESDSVLAAPFSFCRYSGGIMTTISGGRKPRNDIGSQPIIHLSIPSSILIFDMLVIVSGHTEQRYWKPVLLCRPNVLISHARTSEHIQKPSPSM